jgi:hypothetical protein
MPINFQPTGAWKIIKPPQFIIETSYGVTPASGTWSLLGNITGISPNFGIQKEVVRVVGRRTPVTQTKLMEVFAGALRFRPYDSDMMKYGINVADESSPTGNNAESMSIMWSMELNGVEKYFGLQGVKTDKISTEISKDAGVVCGQDYRWMASYLYQDDLSAMGITTPDYLEDSDVPNTAPWTSLAGGVDPFELESVVIPTDRIKIDVNQNLDAISPNGSDSVEYLGASIWEASIDFDIWAKDSTFHDYLMDLELIDGTYQVYADATNPSALTITDLGFDSRTFNLEGNSKNFQRESVAGTPGLLVLT